MCAPRRRRSECGTHQRRRVQRPYHHNFGVIVDLLIPASVSGADRKSDLIAVPVASPASIAHIPAVPVAHIEALRAFGRGLPAGSPCQGPCFLSLCQSSRMA